MRVRRGLATRVRRGLARRAVLAAALTGALLCAIVVLGSVAPRPIGGAVGGATVATIPLADGFVAEGNGTRRIELPAATDDVTVLHVVFDCTSPGLFAWRTGSSPTRGAGCSPTDVLDPASSGIDDFTLDADRTLYIAAAESSTWSVVARFVGERPVAQRVNANGQTYGVIGQDGGTPELVAVTGLDQEGRQVNGYALWSEIESPPPSTPEEAVIRQAENRSRYPNGKPVAVYKADGETRIGTFTIGVG